MLTPEGVNGGLGVGPAPLHGGGQYEDSAAVPGRATGYVYQPDGVVQSQRAVAATACGVLKNPGRAAWFWDDGRLPIKAH